MPSGTLKYDVANRFSAHLGGRYPQDGGGNGTTFRAKILEFLKGYEKVILDFSGVFGIPSSFSEEVFGGMMRELLSAPQLRAELYLEAAFSGGGAESLLKELQRRISLISNEQFMNSQLQVCWRYANDAAVSSSR